jgi:cytochrome c oxidase assembly protein subunit 15
MTQNSTDGKLMIASWHRNLLIAGAVFSVLLISMGGVLCVTQSIRNCPDWPGCFGTFIPPSQPGPILEYTHRALAAVSGLLILSAAITGLVRSPRVCWVTIPPLVAVVLLVEVSYFGAQVVLRGLAPCWAAVDVGSALLVVALMVAAAVMASSRIKTSQQPGRPSFRGIFARLVLATTAVVYIVLVSGILVAGKGSITACLGWPIYSLKLFQADGHGVGNALRWILSFIGIVLFIAMLLLAWRKRLESPRLFKHAAWLGILAFFEALLQVLLLILGHQVSLLIVYTITAAVFWALLVTQLVRAGLEGVHL